MDARATVVLPLALALSACRGEPQASTTPPAPTRLDAREHDRVTIAGQLRAHDGSALRDAEVIVERKGWAEPPRTRALDDDGRFRMEVPPGVYRVGIDAPDHRAASRTTVVTADLRVEGRLRASARLEAAGTARTPPLRWIGESPTTTAMLDFHARWFPAANDLYQRMPRKKNGQWIVTDELRAEARRHAAKARADADAPSDPTTRAFLRAVEIELFAFFIHTPSNVPALREDIAWIIDHASPTDLHWGLSHVFLNFENFVHLARTGADAAFLAELDAWYERRAREHPTPLVAASAAHGLLARAKQRGDQARVAELEALARDERFRDVQPQPVARRAKPAHTLALGKALPPFDFAALGDPDRRITSTDRAGRLYLLEFWSTTCGPCVAEMPTIHEAYAAIHGATPSESSGEAGLRGLEPVASPRIELVFVSVDDTEAEVATFRRESWSMPWTHAFVGHAGMRTLWALYGIRSIPTSVLVDETGTILAMGESLRGDQLLPTLRRALAERDAAPH